MPRILLLFSLILHSHSLLANNETEDIFDSYKDQLVQIRILEASSGTKAGHGSGFVVNKNGYIITNYHVIADLIHKPEQYRAEVVRQDGKVGTLQLLNFDAIHDLALIQTDFNQSEHFKLYTPPLRKGTRVFSIGTPLDLDFTIVEGTYNGLIQESLYEKIHFTGAINRGMSGGPALLADGTVVGVNVASAGNQIGFLVPAKFVKRLIEDTSEKIKLDKNKMLQKLTDQLNANQEEYMAKLLAKPLDTITLNDYQVPGKISGFIHCWGDSNKKEDYLLETISHKCSSDDDLYISRTQASGIVSYGHTAISASNLGRFHFFRLYQRFLEEDYDSVRASKEEVTRFKCNVDFVLSNKIDFKAVLCLRTYKKLPQLYDVIVRAATLNNNDRGLITTLVLAGVSYENGTRLAKKYLESIQWKK